MTTPPYRWCVLFVDADDPAMVVAAVARRLGAGSRLDVFRTPGFRVQVDSNPDPTRTAHFLDWPTAVSVQADDDLPDREMVEFTSALIRHLRAAGYRVGAECDFAAELPPPDRR